MQVIKQISVAANTTVDNVLSGSVYEFPAFNAKVDFGLSGSATGLVATVTSGSDVLQEEGPVPPTNRFPQADQDFTLTDLVGGGERLVIRVRNTTAGALTLFSTTRLTPI
jgi:hypothetical protein